ncbi:hypothetical protein TWF730_011140 [Orbilia blumenaviensis]|uniref:Mid2 domain-containing protein n=1 Tax=Orbilia blumenaviensis TaxID=1796055 RepID=A0AAV9UKG1_9PEZI
MCPNADGREGQSNCVAQQCASVTINSIINVIQTTSINEVLETPIIQGSSEGITTAPCLSTDSCDRTIDGGDVSTVPSTETGAFTTSLSVAGPVSTTLGTTTLTSEQLPSVQETLGTGPSDPSPTSPGEGDGSGSGGSKALSTGAIAGIAVGLGVPALLVLLFLAYRWGGSRARDPPVLAPALGEKYPHGGNEVSGGGADPGIAHGGEVGGIQDGGYGAGTRWNSARGF